MIIGIDRITYGVEDVELCRRFFLDWGLSLKGENDFESLNGCEVRIRHKDDPSLPPAMEPGSTLREVVWGLDSSQELQPLTDPNGLAVKFRRTRKRSIDVKGVPINTWDKAARVDRPSAFYERAHPVEVGHLVLFTDRLKEMEEFYARLGFVVSDRYPGRGVFLRCTPEGGHHDVFALQTPSSKPGLNHVAFAVRDIHEVFGGGLHISRCGWTTEIGPGRHPVSSAYFWYVKCPAGGLAEYYSDEDYVTAAWKPRELTPSPEVFAEWAITGGIDGMTRRQASGPTVESGTAGRASRDK